jgi:hypothetical protein
VAVDRRHVSDRSDPVVGCLDVRDSTLGDVERRTQHDVGQQVVLLHRELGDTVDLLYPGDVGDVPQVTRRRGGLDDRLDVGVVGQVGLDRVEPAGRVEPVDHGLCLLEPRRGDVRRDNSEPVHRERYRRCLADTRRSPGHECHVVGREPLVVQNEHVIRAQLRFAQLVAAHSASPGRRRKHVTLQ